MKKLIISSLILACVPPFSAASEHEQSRDSEQWTFIPSHHFTSAKLTEKDTFTRRGAKARNSNDKVPNDAGFDQMYYWHSQVDITLIQDGDGYFRELKPIPGSSEINAAVNTSTQQRKLRVAVIDGGFNEHEDIPWKADEGHNFYQAFGQVINPQWRSLDDPNDCETGHGNAVGGIIGAIANNGKGIAGALDAELIPIRAFECNLARIVDIADAIRYAAGEKVKTAPVIDKVDLINVSTSAFNGECPEPLQQAVDYAVSEGIQVYVSAGNDNAEVTSKCDGVISVGGSNERRTKWVDSNYGSAIDVMTAGESVYSYHFQGGLGWWDGTSFATPLALSIHGLALQHDLEISHQDIINVMKLTAQPMSADIETSAEDCSGERCGVGLVNAKRVMNYFIATAGDSPYVLRHALAKVNECDQTLYLTELGKASRVCELFELVIDESGKPLEQEVQVVRVAKGSPLLDENTQLILSTKASIILLDGIDTDAYDYGIQFCDTELCSDAPIYPVDGSNANKPSQCVKD